MVVTGASINVIDEQTFSKFREVTLKSTKTKAFAYNQSEPVNFLGKLEAVVETRKRMTVATFYCDARTELWQPTVPVDNAGLGTSHSTHKPSFYKECCIGRHNW